MIFCDFDGVLFDTQRFKMWLVEHGFEENSLRSAESIARIRRMVDKGKLNMKEFLFPDAVEFLQANKGDVIIVSSPVSRNDGDNNNATDELFEEFQAFKIMTSGLADLAQFEVCENKNEVIKKYMDANPDIECKFIDDSVDHLRRAADLQREKLSLIQAIRYRTFKGERFEHDKCDVVENFSFKPFIPTETSELKIS